MTSYSHHLELIKNFVIASELPEIDPESHKIDQILKLTHGHDRPAYYVTKSKSMWQKSHPIQDGGQNTKKPIINDNWIMQSSNWTQLSPFDRLRSALKMLHISLSQIFRIIDALGDDVKNDILVLFTVKSYFPFYLADFDDFLMQLVRIKHDSRLANKIY